MGEINPPQDQTACPVFSCSDRRRACGHLSLGEPLVIGGDAALYDAN